METEPIRELREHYGSGATLSGQSFYVDDRLFLFTGTVGRIEHVWCGLHIANRDLSLTIEGALLFGADATKNKHLIREDEMSQYFSGKDISCDGGLSGPCILTNGKRIILPSVAGDGVFKNILPKSRILKK